MTPISNAITGRASGGAVFHFTLPKVSLEDLNDDP